MVASEPTKEDQKFQNFLGEHPPTPVPPSCFCIFVPQATESWAGPGYEDVVCPFCALVSRASRIFLYFRWEEGEGEKNTSGHSGSSHQLRSTQAKYAIGK